MGYNIPEYLNITNEAEYLSLIQEVQFENPKLKKVEELFRELRFKYSMFDISIIKINADPLMREISSTISDIFGFYTFQLTVEQDMQKNACTISLSSLVDKWNYKKCVIKNNQGIRFTPAAKVNVMAIITSALLLDSNFTDREIVAILLHEIGHNFSDSINNTLGIFSNFKKILMIPSLFSASGPLLLNILRKPSVDFDNYMKKNMPHVVSAFGALSLFLAGYQYISFTSMRALRSVPVVAVSSTINLANNIINKIVTQPMEFIVQKVFKSFTKQDEYTSDSFVAMYGYGPDLASGLLKLESSNPTIVDDIFKSTKIGALYFAFVVESVDFIFGSIMSSHPATGKRIFNILDTLEKEYNKDYIDPKLKKETKKEIDEIRKLIDERLKDESFNGNYWRIAYNKYILANKPDKGPNDKMLESILTKIENLEELK